MEIRSLRQRLEESICTNDRLREQLERRLASTSKASGTTLHGVTGCHAPWVFTSCMSWCWGKGLSTCPSPQVCPATSMLKGQSWGCS